VGELVSTQSRKPRNLRDDFARGAVAIGLAASMLGYAGGAAAEDPPADQEGTITVVGERPDANPYGDPVAPYRVVRSASSRFTEDLQDTPKSITVLSAEAIGDMGATSFRDLFRAQPGVTIGTGEGGNAFGDRFFIRGFDVRNDVYIDGIRDPGVGSRELFAVQQIEIIKGPSSTFGGRGSVGGAVSLVSKQPGEGNWGVVGATLGTDNTRRVTADLNYELTDEITARVNLMTHDSDVAGRDEVFFDRWGNAVAFAYTPNDTLRVGFDYFHMSMDYLPDWGHPYDVSINAPFEVDRNNFYGVTARDFGATFSDVYTGTVDWTISDAVRLHSITRYGQSKNAYTASAPEQPNALLRTVRANAKRRDAVTEYYENQSDLTMRFDTGAIGHTLVVGVDIAHEEVLNRTRAFTECAVLPCTGLTSNPTLNLDNPDNNIPWGRATDVTGRPTIMTDTRALYVLDTLKFSPHWEAFGALRYDTYEVDTSGLAPNRMSDSEFLNGHAGLVYKPSEMASIYLSYATASNPPCEQVDAFALDYGGCDARVTDLDPIRSKSLELGAKFLLLGHLDASLAVFQLKRDGVPIAVGSGATGALGIQDQEVTGFEASLAGNITENWAVLGGVTIMDAEVAHSDIASQIGSDFPNVAENSLTLSSRYQLTSRMHFGGTAIYQSEKFGGTIAASSTQVPEFWRFDLFGGLDVTDSVELSFNILNVGDEVYYDALYRSGTPFVYIAPGRSALVSLDITF